MLRRDNYVVDILPDAEAAIEGADLASYDIAIIGPELKLDNFRTVHAMTALVLRLRDSAGTAGED